jgi:hypothetical protein
MSEKKVVATLNAPKKHSVRYDLRIEGTEKIVGSIYWPKELGNIPGEIKIEVKS